MIASCLFVALQPGHSQAPKDSIVRIAELEIYLDRLDAYKAALKEEISASIRKEPGVLTLYAVSLKGPHFKKYKEQTRRMVKSLMLVGTDPILLGSKGS